MSCKRWEAGEGRRHGQVLCPRGLWLWPRTFPGGRKLLPCGETQGTAQAGQEAGGSLGPVSPGN